MRSDLIVDEINKEDYVLKLCLAKSYTEVEHQIQSFKKGLYEILPADSLKIFSSGELAILISGKSEIDVDDLRTHAIYGGYGKDEPIMGWFWEVVEGMNQNSESKFLIFHHRYLIYIPIVVILCLKGTLKAPFGGFKAAPIEIRRANNMLSLPVSHIW